jgi:hypothetical protein
MKRERMVLYKPYKQNKDMVVPPNNLGFRKHARL